MNNSSGIPEKFKTNSRVIHPSSSDLIMIEIAGGKQSDAVIAAVFSRASDRTA